LTYIIKIISLNNMQKVSAANCSLLLNKLLIEEDKYSYKVKVPQMLMILMYIIEDIIKKEKRIYKKIAHMTTKEFSTSDLINGQLYAAP